MSFLPRQWPNPFLRFLANLIPFFKVYLLPMLAVFFAIQVNWLIAPYLTFLPPFLMFLAAIMLTTWYGGFRAALFGIVLSALTLDYFFIGQIYSFALRPGDAGAIGVFVLEAIGMAFCIDYLRRNEERLRQANAELHDQVVSEQQRLAEKERTEDQIQASLKEKEVLLREVHHRVKNNLQVIYSLLRLQSQSVTDPKALELFQDSQARVKAMALIHETLYQSQDLSRIDIEGYISKLTGQLFKSYGISPNTIELRLDIAPLSLSIETAITCGLLINELVSNSLKYAFPNGRTGEVAIHLLPDSHGTHVLTVSDNGVGLPSTFEVGKAKSLGWQLVPMLVEQLAGTFELHRNAGTTVTLTFSELSYKGRV